MLLRRLMPQTRCSSFEDHPVLGGTETWPFFLDFFPSLRSSEYGSNLDGSKMPTLRERSAHAWKSPCENHATWYVCPPIASLELTRACPSLTWLKAIIAAYFTNIGACKVKSWWCSAAVHTCRPSIHPVLVMRWGILDWFHRAACSRLPFKAAAGLFALL